MSTAHEQQEQTPNTAIENSPSHGTSKTRDDDDLTDQDDTPSCTSSLEEEERKPHWDVGAGDIAIYNDTPSDRNIVRFLQRAKAEAVTILGSVLLRKKRIQYNIVLQVRFSNNYNLPPTPFKSHYIILESAAAIDDTYEVLAQLIVVKAQKFRFVYQILRVEVNIKNIRARCGTFIELPSKLPSFKAIINYRNFDNYCFKYALLTAIKYLLKDPKIASQKLEGIDITKEQINFGGVLFNFAGLTFPVEVRDVRIFEENNPTLSVNVFGLEKKKTQYVIVGPLYRTRREQDTHINLLFLENGQRNMTHYAYITQLAKLMKGTSKNHSLPYYCNTCLKKFTQFRKYQEHKTERNSCEVLRTLS